VPVLPIGRDGWPSRPHEFGKAAVRWASGPYRRLALRSGRDYFSPVKFLAILLASLSLQAPAWACAGCRVISEDLEDTTVMAGFAFSWGVVAMLVFLFALCSGLGWFVMKTIKAVDANHSSVG